VVRQRHLTQHGDMPAPISSTSQIVWWGAGKGRVVTREVQSPGRPATRWMSVDSISTACTYADLRHPLPTMPLVF
jgi:hypothetical protein